MRTHYEVQVWTQAVNGSGRHEYTKMISLPGPPPKGYVLNVRAGGHLIPCEVENGAFTEGGICGQIFCTVMKARPHMGYEQIDKLFADDPDWRRVENPVAVPV